jgi:hypothetical protein
VGKFFYDKTRIVIGNNVGRLLNIDFHAYESCRKKDCVKCVITLTPIPPASFTVKAEGAAWWDLWPLLFEEEPAVDLARPDAEWNF